MNKLICQHCQTLFMITPGSLGRFCSLSCSASHVNKERVLKNIQKYKESPTLCKCCGIALPYIKRHRKFCSRSCSSKLTNNDNRKRGPTAIEKYPYSTIKFILCNHTNQWYSNRNTNGSIRKSSTYIKTVKENYYANARFKFNVYHYPSEFNLALLSEAGWYTCPGKKRKLQPKNINGVSRDHMISVGYGFANNIDPKIISHPANCQLILHSENKIKHSKCCITLVELNDRIKAWNQKYIERATGIEPATNNLEG